MASSIDHSSELGKIYEKVYNKDKSHDVVLRVGDMRIPVHRIILAAHSEFFWKLFYENQLSEANAKEITVEAPAEAFQFILRYMYTGILDLSEHDEYILEVLELSRRFGLTKLEEALIPQVSNLTNFDNLAAIIKAAVIMESDVLIKKCCRILNRRTEFIGTTDFLTLTVDEISTIFAHEASSVVNMKKFEAISSWIKAHQSAPKLLEVVNLDQLSNTQLLTVAASNLYPTETLTEIIAARVSDVPEETPCEGLTICTPFETFNEDLASPSARKYTGPDEIVIDFGAFYTFNFIQFNLDKPCNVSISISRMTEYAADSASWIHLRQLMECTDLQTVYLPPTTSQFVRIKGISTCTALKVQNLSEFPSFVDSNFSLTRENKVNSHTAYIEGTRSKAALHWDFIDRGVATLSNEASVLVIHMRIPTALRQIRFRLWDFDGRVQSFRFTARYRGSIKYDLFLSNVRGWHSVNFSPINCDRFEFHNASNEKVRLVHFEGS